MYVLGIETTAHTFGASVINTATNTVLSNARDSYTTTEGGMIPVEVAEHHIEKCDEVLRQGLKDAGVTLQDISLIAVSNAPGLGHALRVGVVFAKSLALEAKKPLVSVNHCIAHLEIGRVLTKAKDPVLLYASGANTQVIAYEAGKYRVFGETLDIGIGNFLDTLGRELGLGFPAGPAIEKLASQSNNLLDLPYSVKGMDVSFSGLFTNLKRKANEGIPKTDIAYSAQEIVFAELIEVSERAMAHLDKKELLLGGGVACNKRLQAMAKRMCEDRGASCYVLENQYNVDNAAMIAFAGHLKYASNPHDEVDTIEVLPYERTDDVIVTWR